ncbi:MAG: conjugal transfer protein TrbL [Blastococcus sp.]|jgi:uncharacterized membrane protein|nr:conjugal transfer protein TrbL [Blastococcus sp.]
MDTVLNVLHVVAAVFLVGPMAILPMTAMRAVRAENGPMVALLARSTRVFSLASLLVAVLGFGVLGMADEKFDLSVTTSWVLTSIILYLVALALSLALVVPSLNRAAGELEAGRGEAARALYGRIAAGSGVVSLLLVVVTVLMVWKP